jgi:hypothetical protein
MKSTEFDYAINNFNNSLLTCVKHFRICEDNEGLNMLTESFDIFSCIINANVCLGNTQINLTDSIILCKKLYALMLNNDIIGITDFIEFSMCPAAETMFKEAYA